MPLRKLNEIERTTLATFEDALWPLEVEILATCDDMERPPLHHDLVGFTHPDLPDQWRWVIGVRPDGSAELNGPDYGKGLTTFVILPSLWMALEAILVTIQGRTPTTHPGVVVPPGASAALLRRH